MGLGITENVQSKVFFLLATAAVLLGGGTVRAEESACTEGQQWCEHKVATFCENDGCSNVRTEGQCISKERSCEEFWCGNRQCSSSFLITRDVCCVYYPADNSPQYSCADSELSCRGNSAQIMIRPPTVASAHLQN
jgi:hypothetical protein